MIINELQKKDLEKQGYRIVGNHSAVKICTWTKKSLLDEDFCYKQKFYNIKSHLCCQMTPSLLCVNRCLFCWRDISLLIGKKLVGEDEPETIIEGCIRKQRELLSGFFGNERVNKKKIKEAQNPKYWAISLSGEPTIYTKLSSLIKELHRRGNCTFLVTNGLFPKRIESLDELPVQLYVSLDAPNKEIYNKIDRPTMKDSWERLNQTLELLPSLETRTVLRLTLVRNLNLRNAKEYSKLIKKANPMFVELKAFMAVGYAGYRLQYSDMPSHEEIKNFAKEICSHTGLKIIDEKENSRVVLLAEKDSKKRKLKFD